MDKIGRVIVNSIFLVILLSLIWVNSLKYLEDGPNTLFIVSAILLAAGLIFNWYVFNKYVAKKGKDKEQ